MFEASDTKAGLGRWDQNTGHFRDPYSTEVKQLLAPLRRKKKCPALLVTGLERRIAGKQQGSGRQEPALLLSVL